MHNSSHIHRFSFSSSLFTFLLSFFFLFLSISVLILKVVPHFASGEAGFSDYVVIAFMIFLLFPMGLALLVVPFVTKIVVKANGLEYHNATLILHTDWKDLANIGYRKSTPAGKTLVVVALGGKLEFRNWTTPFRNFFVKQPQGIEILVSQFGAANGHSLETDILVNVAQQEQLSDDVELV